MTRSTSKLAAKHIASVEPPSPPMPMPPTLSPPMPSPPMPSPPMPSPPMPVPAEPALPPVGPPALPPVGPPALPPVGPPALPPVGESPAPAVRRACATARGPGTALAAAVAFFVVAATRQPRRGCDERYRKLKKAMTSDAMKRKHGRDSFGGSFEPARRSLHQPSGADTAE